MRPVGEVEAEIREGQASVEALEAGGGVMLDRAAAVAAAEERVARLRQELVDSRVDERRRQLDVARDAELNELRESLLAEGVV